MIENVKARIWVNRVLAFLLGALLIYAVMSLSIVKNVKEENEALKKELYDPGRLLTNAKGFFENGNYSEAMKTLDTLFEKHPGASEMVEGKQLYAEVEAEKNALDRKWEAAVGAIREEWATNMAAQLRTEFEKDREIVPDHLDPTLIEAVPYQATSSIVCRSPLCQVVVYRRTGAEGKQQSDC
jgi:hypothetical protein